MADIMNLFLVTSIYRQWPIFEYLNSERDVISEVTHKKQQS